VVAGNDGVRPGGEQRLADLFGDAEAVRRVLAVDDDEVDGEVLAQLRDCLLYQSDDAYE